jgi:hypothetical protein
VPRSSGIVFSEVMTMHQCTRIAAVGLLAAGLSVSSAALAWGVAAYSAVAVAPQLPTADQAMVLAQSPRAPLWWLRAPHQRAQSLGWLGVPAREDLVTDPTRPLRLPSVPD